MTHMAVRYLHSTECITTIVLPFWGRKEMEKRKCTSVLPMSTTLLYYPLPLWREPGSKRRLRDNCIFIIDSEHQCPLSPRVSTFKKNTEN